MFWSSIAPGRWTASGKHQLKRVTIVASGEPTSGLMFTAQSWAAQAAPLLQSACLPSWSQDLKAAPPGNHFCLRGKERISCESCLGHPPCSAPGLWCAREHPRHCERQLTGPTLGAVCSSPAVAPGSCRLSFEIQQMLLCPEYRQSYCSPK